MIKAVEGHFEKDGRKFIPVGHCEEPALLIQAKAEGWLSNYMERVGRNENVLHIHLEAPESTMYPLNGYVTDKGRGDFSVLWNWLGPVVDEVVKQGVLLSLGTFQPSQASWGSHPYILSGLATSWEGLYASPCRDALEARLQFLVEKIGEGNIFQIELHHELYEQRNEWIADMSNRLSRYTTVMRSVSIGAEWCGRGFLQNDLGESLSFLAFEGYGADRLFIEQLPWYVNGQACLDRRVANVRKLVDFWRKTAPVGRPMLCVETPRMTTGFWGKLGMRWSLSSVSDAAVEACFDSTQRAMLASGCAGPGFSWTAWRGGLPLSGHPNALTHKMYDYQLALKALC